MAKRLFNNSPKTKRLRYKVDGKTFRVDIAPYGEVEVPNLTEYAQVLNSRSRERLEKMDDDSIAYTVLKGIGLKIPDKYFDNYNRGSKSSILNNLSRSSQEAYNSLSEGDYLQVTKQEYNNILSNLENATVYGVTGDDLEGKQDDEIRANNWAFLYGQEHGITAGSYIIGFSICMSSELESGKATASLWLSTNNSDNSNTFIQFGNDVTFDIDDNTIKYFIAKTPTMNNGTEKTFFAVLCDRPRAKADLGYDGDRYGSDNDSWETDVIYSSKQQVMASTVVSWS